MPGDLVSIGVVTVDYRRPQLRWTSSPTTHGLRPCSITGLVSLSEGLTLSALFANPALQESIGGYTGAKQYLIFSGDVLESFTGWYLIQSYDHEVQREFMFGTTGQKFSPFSMSAVYVP